ncbi:hypothetical protein ACI3PL_28975, partial [Lacticaseibacillus paracasei]
MIRKACATSTGVEFEFGSYADAKPIPGQVVYIDPPYANRSAEGIAGKRKALAPEFDHVDFWNRVHEWSNDGTRVFVSEETA